jgi:TusA-related sulfurtransferase
MLTAMKRFLQLVGEMKNYRLPTAKRALQELAADDELVIVVPEQSLVGEIQQWATSQGFTVAAPKKMLDGLARWQLSVKKTVPAPVAEEKPATPAPTPPAAPAAPATPAPAAAPSPADASAH